MRRRDLIVGLSTAAALSVHAAQAQTTKPSQPAIDDNFLLSHFYLDPEPARLVGLLERLQKNASGWNAFPPAVGFFAIVFQRRPAWIDKLVPDHPDSRTAVTVAAALRLCGQPAIAPALQSQLSQAGTDATLQAELAGLPPRLEDLQAVTPTHLDILWGASFASGDERYVRKVTDALARTANRSELVALDIARVVLALSGGPRDILPQLKDKYGEAGAREIIFAATAAWAIESNAQQHPFVDRFLTAYIAANSGSPAAKILTALRPRKRV
jgi:hypothetical protein